MKKNLNHKSFPLSGKYAWFVWALGVSFVVFLFSIQTSYAIVSPKIESSLNLNLPQMGLIAAIYTWVFAIAQLIGGALLDALGVRRVITTSVLIVTLGVFLLGFSNGFYSLLLAQCVLAIGACTGFVGAGCIGEDWFGPAKFSLMFGLVQMIVALTSAFSQNIFNIALQTITWAYLFKIVGVIGVALVILHILFLKDRSNHSPKFNNSKHFFKHILNQFKLVIKIPHVWFAAIGGGLTFSVMLALGVLWAPRLLIVHGVDLQDANIATSMVWLGLALGSFLIIKLSDIFKTRKKIIILTNIIQLIILSIILFIPNLNFTQLIILMLIFGCMNAGHMLAFSTVEDIVPLNEVGCASSVVNGFMFIMSGLMMTIPAHLITGTIHSLHQAQIAFIPLLICLIIASIVGMVLKESFPRK